MDKTLLNKLIGEKYNGLEEYRKQVDNFLKENFDNLYLNYWDWDYDRIYQKENDIDAYIASIELCFKTYNENDIIIIEDVFWEGKYK